MNWLRKNNIKAILAVTIFVTALLLLASCQGGDGSETAPPETTAPAVINSCLSCHSDQDQLMALAVDEEPVEAAESSGEG